MRAQKAKPDTRIFVFRVTQWIGRLKDSPYMVLAVPGESRYRLPDIVASCTQEILELHSTPVAENTGRELWVRGPDRHWHRYVIFPDRIESVEMYGMSVSRHLGQQTLPVG